jgi:hypothetical protein
VTPVVAVEDHPAAAVASDDDDPVLEHDGKPEQVDIERPRSLQV